jgi:hypothetical protein
VYGNQGTQESIKQRGRVSKQWVRGPKPEEDQMNHINIDYQASVPTVSTGHMGDMYTKNMIVDNSSMMKDAVYSKTQQDIDPVNNKIIKAGVINSTISDKQSNSNILTCVVVGGLILAYVLAAPNAPQPTRNWSQRVTVEEPE